MIASLYQSGSSSAADFAVVKASVGTVRLAVSSAMDALAPGPEPPASGVDLEDVPLEDLRIETDVVPAAMPRVRGVVEQVAHDEDVGVEGRLDEAMLHVMRIEVDDHQHARAAVGCGFAVGDDLRVVRRVELPRVIELERGLRMADAIDPADELAD